MAPLIKDAVEISNPVSETTQDVSTAPPAPAPKPSSGGMRADALSLDVAVKIHGSRVKEVVRGITPHTEPFEEQTNTMIVFPQGGVLRMTTPVNAGQMVVITNLKTRQDAICRVVKVRTNSSQQSYVEVEFTSRQPGYWGVNFPSDGPSAAAYPSHTPSASPAAPPPVASSVAPPVARPNSIAPAAKPFDTTVSVSGVQPFIVPPALLKPAPKPESTFISIGSQEDVQVSASSTVTSKLAAPVLEPFGAPRHVREAPKSSSPVLDISALSASLDAVAPAAPPASVSMEELRGDPSPSLPAHPDELNSEVHPAATELSGIEEHVVESQPVPEAPSAPVFNTSLGSTRSSFGSFGRASLTLGRADSSDAFGTRLDSSFSDSPSTPSASHQNWVLIAACVAVLFVAVAGGIYYFRSLKSGNSVAHAAPVATPAAPSGVLAAQGSPVPGGAASSANSTVAIAQPLSASVNAPAQGGIVTTEEKKVPALIAPVRPVAKPAPAVTNDMVASTLNAHPVSSQRGSATDAGPAPSYDASSDTAQNEALSGAIPTAANINVPEPKIQPDGPVKIGGQVKEARLLSSVNPVYPAAAKESGVQGDVVIHAVVDKTGRVREMKVLSGPILLRQAALNALREWRYQPSTLDGQPIDGQMVVTLQFRR